MTRIRRIEAASERIVLYVTTGAMSGIGRCC
jgi:hypothetical protein